MLLRPCSTGGRCCGPHADGNAALQRQVCVRVTLIADRTAWHAAASCSEASVHAVGCRPPNSRAGRSRCRLSAAQRESVSTHVVHPRYGVVTTNGLAPAGPSGLPLQTAADPQLRPNTVSIHTNTKGSSGSSSRDPGLQPPGKDDSSSSSASEASGPAVDYSTPPVVALAGGDEFEQPPESGILPEDALRALADSPEAHNGRGGSSSKAARRRKQPAGLGLGAASIGKATLTAAPSTSSSSSSTTATPRAGASSSSAYSSPVGSATAAAAAAAASSSASRVALFPPSERSQIQESWDALMRWSKSFRRQQAERRVDPLAAADKVVVFGGGSFGTAMGVSLARQKQELDVVLLLRDPYLCRDINGQHCNTKYLPNFKLPRNVRATTDAQEAIAGASYAVHAVPVQHSRAFLSGIREVLPPKVPIVCVSKGLEVGSGCMMSEVIPGALGRRQPAVFISGPSFAKEVMQGRPTGVVAASRDAALAREVQDLFASPSMRVNLTTDVIGVEICGALKNVLAIAAGIVEGLELGHNALAALIAQGCAEIRWLAEKLGAKPATMSGLSGLGDIMLTCYGDLSRNRSVGVRLGRGERLEDILASSSQVAEGVATAGVVVALARKYRVSLPVLTAVAQVLDNNLTPAQAVAEIMSLPQIEEH